MSEAAARYRAEWARSHDDREAFWLDAAAALDWESAPTVALAQDAGRWSWFPDGRLNLSVNALDRHVDAGRGEQTALIFDSAMTGTQERVSYRELRERTARFAGVLRAHGVGRGDRVVVYLPMIPEAIVAMLACARIGAVHSVVFGGFGATELAARIEDAGARVVVTASGGLEPARPIDYVAIVSEALETAKTVDTVIVKARPGFPPAPAGEPGGASWVDWEAAVAGAEPADPVAVASTDPLYILYTSGTTGSPKGVVRDTGGYGAALAWSMRNIYGIGAGEVFWTASDVGWVVGHSYIVYAPLLVGATTVLYEGKPVGTPDAGAFWRVVDEHRVSVMFTAPTAIRAIRRLDPELALLGGRTTSLRALFLAGERADPETLRWIETGLDVPVVDHWWQTETGWPIAANPLGLGALPAKPGSATVPMPGYRIAVLDAAGREVPAGTEGNIAIELPLPPGTLTDIWGGGGRFADAYLSTFPGYYATGDSGRLDDDGYLSVMGRTDDVINVAGHRLSTGALEEVLAKHDAVAECAVIGVKDELKGQRAVGFVTLTAAGAGEQVGEELVALVRRHIGPVAAFRDVVLVERLPKTRSGKILRKTLRQIMDGEPYRVPATIEDPDVIDAVIQTLGERIADAPAAPTAPVTAAPPVGAA
ncbi:AMP-binding protein [Agromyces archimandritae]|uniref:AMP-binding protein n=1 Tax=Agromyces archimandritae TaxID=2781962 RepID=A0A975INA5_9MICO|nr:AMP-binding protein [Agromyces archimandritae]QTX04417.1 AMP-binding protein [Agromyces archimandritae]